MYATSLYPALYAVKIAAVTAALLLFRGPLADIRPQWGVVGPSILVGSLIVATWLVVDKMVPYPHLGSRVGFDPLSLETTSGRAAFLAVRLYGLVLVVPVMEELFWRSFLMRYLSTPHFLSLPIGRFSLAACGWMVALSALAHTEWLVAAPASLIFAL